MKSYAVLASVLAGVATAAGSLFGQERGKARDEPITIDTLGEAQNLEQLTGESTGELQVTGFGVGSFVYDQNSRDNSFSAGKVAVSLFREVNSHVWAFAQLTSSLEAGVDGGEPSTETEIDNLLVGLTPPGAVNFSLSFGKFDAPIGFERDDEPLNFQATASYNVRYARPVKMVGLVGRWTIGPQVDLAAYAANGWDADLAPNHGKTGGVRAGLLPAKSLNLGLSGVLGSEGEQPDSHRRYLLNLDYTWQPNRDWIVAGEANLGGEADVALPGETARWTGATLTILRRLGRGFGLAVRGDVLHDRDGARTGRQQTLASLTFTPLHFLGIGRQGIFANVEHTTFRIPRFQVRAEARVNHSSELAFPKADRFVQWQWEYVLQLVALF